MTQAISTMTMPLGSMTFPVLETERLVLRAIHDDDLDALRDIFGDDDVAYYLADQDGAITDDAELLLIIHWANRIYANGSGIRWGICLKATSRLIGMCGFHLLDGRNQHAEVGYDLAKAYWRQGIMTEALRPVLRYGFETLKLHRLEANVTEGNIASAKTLLKLGFQQEGVWRERAFLRGQFYDLLQFGLLRAEFESP